MSASASSSSSSSSSSSVGVYSSEEISDLISSSVLNESLLTPLENYVNQQFRLNTYDEDANRCLLKLYMFFPDSVKVEMVGRILLKCFQRFPAVDFLTFQYLIHEKIQQEEPVKSILKLANALDNAQFKKFWKDFDNSVNSSTSLLKHDIENCVGLEESLRNFIALTISNTYTVVPITVLKDCLNLNDKSKLDEWIEKLGWKKSDDGKSVEIPSTNSNSTATNAANNSAVAQAQQQQTQQQKVVHSHSAFQEAVSLENIAKIVANYS